MGEPYCIGDSIEKTFVSHVGSYEFTVMPFGLKNAPSIYVPATDE